MEFVSFTNNRYAEMTKKETNGEMKDGEFVPSVKKESIVSPYINKTEAAPRKRVKFKHV